ncbi:MAG TPA: glycosyltransferase family 39 protein [Chitinophagaceae bacterium]|nr:glycosyltransferase family 39 protein [Chitinophagaceae bacterium]
MLNDITTGERRAFYILIIICIAVYISGWFIPLMEVDAVQYANISREMLLHKSFLQVYDQGRDYLDKPPMLFWLSSLSMYLFGINDIAYRLPSFLFSILAIYSTYRLALLYYSEKLALLGALILASCQAMFLINHDVRTDTMLMGWVILSLWQLAEWLEHKKWQNLVIASVAIAGGMLTKGPVALMIIVFAFVPHLLLTRRFKDFFRWQYLVMLVIIALLLVPMSVGLYMQFDLHSEKTVNGLQHVSGLRFFYWTQSFGRITGENVWHENDSFLFLFQNMLWSFLPWVLLFSAGLIYSVKLLAGKKFLLQQHEEYISTGGFIITYCALASSRAQLPHYIFVVFPLAAIITARVVYVLLYAGNSSRLKKTVFITHAIILSLLAVVVLLLLWLPFPPVNWLLVTLFIIACAVTVLAIVKKWLAAPRLLILLAGGAACINLFLNTGFYRQLLQYQTGIGVTEAISRRHIDKLRFFVYDIDAGRSLDFYGNYSFPRVTDTSAIKPGGCLLTSLKGYNSLNKSNYQLIYTGQSFHVTTLTLKFLNPATRGTKTQPYYIVRKL